MGDQNTAVRQNAPRETKVNKARYSSYCRFVPAGELQRTVKVRLLIPFTLAAFSAFSQPLTFGVKGGVPLTDLLSTPGFPSGLQPGPGFTPPGATSTTNPYIVGATVEVRLPRNFSVEFDALFRHFSYQWGFFSIANSSEGTATSNAWELPLLLKYKLHGRFLRPYIDGGVAWDLLQGFSATTIYYGFAPPPVTTHASDAGAFGDTTAGLVIGGGVDIHTFFLHISPEVRYTRWTSQNLAEAFVASNQNQVEFLLGVTF
jgi:hypothetical protein